MTFSLVFDLVGLALFLIALCGVAVALAIFIAVMVALAKFLCGLLIEAIEKRRKK